MFRYFFLLLLTLFYIKRSIVLTDICTLRIIAARGGISGQVVFGQNILMDFGFGHCSAGRVSGSDRIIRPDPTSICYVS